MKDAVCPGVNLLVRDQLHFFYEEGRLSWEGIKVYIWKVSHLASSSRIPDNHWCRAFIKPIRGALLL